MTHDSGVVPIGVNAFCASSPLPPSVEAEGASPGLFGDSCSSGPPVPTAEAEDGASLLFTGFCASGLPLLCCAAGSCSGGLKGPSTKGPSDGLRGLCGEPLSSLVRNLDGSRRGLRDPDELTECPETKLGLPRTISDLTLADVNRFGLGDRTISLLLRRSVLPGRW
mmetsp:Transcript_32472/g.76252  ORF Transcript_32472/g.76252 Transcript_32472/m.76252 type:complete len:166 (-) Transcript_32472:504-1001(-)